MLPATTKLRVAAETWLIELVAKTVKPDLEAIAAEVGGGPEALNGCAVL